MDLMLFECGSANRGGRQNGNLRFAAPSGADGADPDTTVDDVEISGQVNRPGMVQTWVSEQSDGWIEQ